MKTSGRGINSYAFLLVLFSFLLLGGCIPHMAELFPSSTSSAPPPAPIPMEFVLIPAGSFTMGDPNFEAGKGNGMPQHTVTISKPFYMGKYEVTQAQWREVMGDNPAHFRGPNNPVENVSWEDAQEFIRLLNTKEGHNRYRLPTEAEWEYAARAGTSTAYSFGDNQNELAEYGWFKGNAMSMTHPVGEKQPNPWGLYDMYGNVFEWVQDWYGKDFYSASPAIAPEGPSSGSHRVIRGGGWAMPAEGCRSDSRGSGVPDASGRIILVGFRLAQSTE